VNLDIDGDGNVEVAAHSLTVDCCRQRVSGHVHVAVAVNVHVKVHDHD
jgi:hypothetical protein